MSSVNATWIGKTLENGRFVVAEKIGEGGMAVVFKALDRHSNADVVIKVPKQYALEDETFLKRFTAENRAMIKLRFPHIVNIVHVGEESGWPYAVLEYLPGGNLDDYRKGSGGKLSLNVVAAWLPPIADALDFIHTKGYVHRDVKPENILFDGKAEFYLSDFGIAKAISGSSSKAKITATGIVMGTPDYMAPELILDRPIDGRIDQFGLAMTVYECLSGRLPFPSTSPASVMVMQTTRKIPLLSAIEPSVPESVSEVVMKAISKNPNERFPSCGDFCGAFLASVVEGKTKTTRETTPHATRSPTKRIAGGSSKRTSKSKLKNEPHKKPESPIRLLQDWRMQLVTGALLTFLFCVWFFRNDKGTLEQQPQALESVAAAVTEQIETESSEETPFVVSDFPGEGMIAGDEWTNDGTTFVWCPPGTFRMGSPSNEPGRKGDESQFQVTLTQGFWIGKFEVTQGDWRHVMETAPWDGQEQVASDPDCAASYISWDDALEFCRKLTDTAHQAGRLRSGWKISLPTEAQWEYACRAGAKTAYSFGADEKQLDRFAWFADRRGERFAHPVGRKSPNAWKVHDMQGNVWEWCWDGYSHNRRVGPIDPKVTPTGANRTIRGGSWKTPSEVCRSAARYFAPSNQRDDAVGFRVVIVAE